MRSHPPAAAFAPACATGVLNGLARVKAALRAAHGPAIEARLSSHAIAASLETIVVEPVDWHVCARVTAPALAQWLPDQARQVPRARYAETPPCKTPSRPEVKRQNDRHRPPVSITELPAAERVKTP